MSSVSDWERKRTMERMFMNVPPAQRESFMAQVKKEQDKMDKEVAADAEKEADANPPSFLVQAPEIEQDPEPESIQDNFEYEAAGVKIEVAKFRTDKAIAALKAANVQHAVIKGMDLDVVMFDRSDVARAEKALSAAGVTYRERESVDPFVQGREDNSTPDVKQVGEASVASLVKQYGGSLDKFPNGTSQAHFKSKDDRDKFIAAAKSAGTELYGKEKIADPDHGTTFAVMVGEALTGSLGLITPKPMLVATSPGVEVLDDPPANCSMTSSGTDNGHTHLAYYDEAGNGYTSMDDGHNHDVKSFVVAPYQTPDGTKSHEHPGVLKRTERSPGSEYKPYDGVVS